MKKLFLPVFLLLSIHVYSQKNEKPYTFGTVSTNELEMTIYEKDTTANAVVLFEHGNTIVEHKNNKTYLNTTVYGKIKILNKEGVNHATIKIHFYNDKDKSKVKNIKAVTHNINQPKTHLNSKHIYTNIINEHWKEVTFTFPNVKAGSVLEYQYNLETQSFFNFNGWTFQSEIPKIQSEFHALIPGNWRYNRSLKGLLKLSTNEASIKKNCFSFGYEFSADCEQLTYIMKDIPAFIEEEQYSTTKNNYISKIEFELAEIFYTDGTSKKFTTSWKETDKWLKRDESIGRQIKNKSFFLKKIPEELLAIEDEVQKSKSIYEHIQNHYSLNSDKTYIFKDIEVKKAFTNKFGNFSEINLALINALQAANIDAKILLLSTRDRGFPTKAHAVISDFNYLVAHITINNQNYLLDASDKLLPFNMLPFKALNSYGRVLDFKNGSYWHDIKPYINTFNRTSLKVDLTEDTVIGKLKIIDNGYFALQKRRRINATSKDKYLLEIENSSKNIIINTYKNTNLNKLNKKLIEELEIEFEDHDAIGNMIYFNPFIKKIETNPFLLNERTYPVDFGYKKKLSYIVKVNTPKDYKIISTPKSVKLSLPNKGGAFLCNTTINNNEITIFLQYNLNKTIYSPQEYLYLKKFFNQIIKTQNSLITLEKINTVETKS